MKKVLLAMFLLFAATITVQPALADPQPQADEHANQNADDNASDEGMLHALCNAA